MHNLRMRDHRMKRGSRCSFLSANVTLVAILVHDRILGSMKGLFLHGKLLGRPSIPLFLFLIILPCLKLLTIKGTLLSWSRCLLISILFIGIYLRGLEGATVSPFLLFPSLLMINPLLSWLLRKRVLLPAF